MPTFTPPTAQQSIEGDRFWSRYSIPVGQSVVLRDGVYQLTPFPWAGELEGLTEGTDYFLGGRSYHVTDAVATALNTDGFETVASDGYGMTLYGEFGFGD